MDSYNWTWKWIVWKPLGWLKVAWTICDYYQKKRIYNSWNESCSRILESLYRWPPGRKKEQHIPVQGFTCSQRWRSRTGRDTKVKGSRDFLYIQSIPFRVRWECKGERGRDRGREIKIENSSCLRFKIKDIKPHYFCHSSLNTWSYQTISNVKINRDWQSFFCWICFSLSIHPLSPFKIKG